MDKKKLIVVLGVPRSGTSAITRCLQTLGAEFGDSLVEGIEGVNNKGFWEDKSILNLNERILQTLNKVWCDISPFSLDDFEKEDLFQYKKEAVEIIQQKVEKHSFLALKEPRITKLLPFWKMVFEACGLKPTYIVALREPSDVFNSFKRLENIMVRPADIFPINVDLIWLSYLANTLQLFIEKEDALIVNYNSIIDNPVESIRKISIKLGVEINQGELKEYSEEFIDKSLNHSVGNDKDVFYLTEKLFNCYLSISESEDFLISDDEIFNLKFIKNKFYELIPLFGMIDFYRERFILESDLLKCLSEEKDREIESKEYLKLEMECELKRLKLECESVQTQLKKVVKENDIIINSYSMRLIKPLRKLKLLIEKVLSNANE